MEIVTECKNCFGTVVSIDGSEPYHTDTGHPLCDPDGVDSPAAELQDDHVPGATMEHSVIVTLRITYQEGYLLGGETLIAHPEDWAWDRIIAEPINDAEGKRIVTVEMIEHDDK
jgi:hypothetical protein